MFVKISMAICLICVAACAKQPASIRPMSVAGLYEGISCKQARLQYSKEAGKVPALVSSQQDAVTGDALGVFLIGVPVSSVAGDDIEGEIAATKGKLIALSTKLDSCGIQHTPVNW